MAESYKKVIVSPLSTKPKVRLAVEVLLSNSQYTEQRDLFLRGFAAVQQKDSSDPTSFYQIAGIHGLPYVAYDGVNGSYSKKEVDQEKRNHQEIRWGGYCHHGDILFPTWHRPYIMLLEQCIYNEAKQLVEIDYRNDPRYKKALEDLRFPYWDWASPSTLSQGLPSFFFEETSRRVAVSVGEDKSKSYGDIPNPLRAYTLPKNLGDMSLVGDQGNPAQRPYVPKRGVPYTPEGFSTVRHPTDRYLSNADGTNLEVIQECTTTYRPNIYQVFLAKEWRKFSNHGFDDDGNFASIEYVHDAVHGAIGDNGGHMSYPDVASFDPIFFLHHCNVDRFTALWQACHPNVWIKADNRTHGTYTDPIEGTIDANTDLTPFRKNGTEFWNSNDVRDVKKLGYTYSELEKKYPKGGLLKKLLDYYHPNRYIETHWQVHIRVQKNYFGNPFTIRVFLDEPKATASTPTSSPNYAGSMYIFARGKDSPCGNCKNNPDRVVNGSVDLTLAMERLDVLEDRDDDLDGNQITLVAVARDGEGIPLDQIGLKLVDLYKITEEEEDFKYTFVSHIPIPNITLPDRSNRS